MGQMFGLIGAGIGIVAAIVVSSFASGCGGKTPATATHTATPARTTVVFTEPAVLSPPCSVCTFSEDEAAAYTLSIASR